jgi:hypothetical protein
MLGIFGVNLFRANSTQQRQSIDHNKEHAKTKKPVISYDYFQKKSNVPHQAALRFGTHPNRSIYG